MLDFFVHEVLAPLLIGAIAWLCVNWIAAPFVEFRQIRRDTREEMNFWKHLAKDSVPVEREKGSDALRRLSARLEAQVASAGFSNWYLKLSGYNLGAAHSALHGLANVSAMSSDETITLRHEVELALKLPASENAERIERIKVRMASN
jgi:hypothetical protein